MLCLKTKPFSNPLFPCLPKPEKPKPHAKFLKQIYVMMYSAVRENKAVSTTLT